MHTEQLDSLVVAAQRYPSLAGGHFYDEVIDEVHHRIMISGSVGKADIGALLLWKRLNLNTRWTMALNQEPDQRVREITGEAIKQAGSGPILEAARIARTTLLPLPGCSSGAAVASTILTAAWPDRMAVYDRRAAATLRHFGYEFRRGVYSEYMTAVCALAAELSNHTGTNWLPRDVDKALFQWRV